VAFQHNHNQLLNWTED